MTDCQKCMTYTVLWCKDCSERKYTCKFCGITNEELNVNTPANSVELTWNERLG
jgi:hypothetical protein